MSSDKDGNNLMKELQEVFSFIPDFKFEYEEFDYEKYKTDRSDEFDFCYRCPRTNGIVSVEDRIDFLENSSMITFNDINPSLESKENFIDKRNYLYLPLQDRNSYHDPFDLILEELEAIFKEGAILAKNNSQYQRRIRSNSNKEEWISLIGASLGELSFEFERGTPVFLVISRECNPIKSISVPNLFVYDQIKDKPTKNIYSCFRSSRFDYQVKEKIDLSMVKAIGISDVEIKRYAYIIHKAFVSEYEDEVIIEGIAQDIKAKYLNSLLELMNKYGFSLPIVDVSTGEPIIIEPEMLLEETPIEFIDKHPYRQRKYIRKKVLEILERK